MTPSVRAIAVARGVGPHKAGTEERRNGTDNNRFLRLRSVLGAFYWISFDGRRVLRGESPDDPEELQPGFIEAMARAGRES
jgi:hypothetical protein